MQNLLIDISYKIGQQDDLMTPHSINLSYDNNIFIKDLSTGKLYIGNGSNIVDEIKTDKSNNWAKTFFYGGD